MTPLPQPRTLAHRPCPGAGASSRPVRWLLLALLLAPLLLVATPAKAGTDLTYRIGKGVSAEDESTVREGIILAEEYVAATLTDVRDEDLVVNIRHSEDITGGGATAFAGGSSIAVFTDSPGWTAVAPFERVQVVAHQIRGESGKTVAIVTFADATGRVFWLITLPDELGPGPARLSAGCGGEREPLRLEIAAA